MLTLLLCRTDTAKRVLEPTISWRENKVLGSAKFANDVTVTHSDAGYMRKHYEMEFSKEQAVSALSGKDQSSRLEAGRKNFKPMYLIKMYPQDLTKLEMSFNCERELTTINIPHNCSAGHIK